jgi:hypothetical protein
MMVLCIDDKFTDEQKRKLADWPKEGHIYSIRRTKYYIGGRVGYYLNEIINYKSVGSPKSEPTFNPRRFVNLPHLHSKVVISQEELKKLYELIEQ